MHRRSGASGSKPRFASAQHPRLRSGPSRAGARGATAIARRRSGMVSLGAGDGGLDSRGNRFPALPLHVRRLALQSRVARNLAGPTIPLCLVGERDIGARLRGSSPASVAWHREAVRPADWIGPPLERSRGSRSGLHLLALGDRVGHHGPLCRRPRRAEPRPALGLRWLESHTQPARLPGERESSCLRGTSRMVGPPRMTVWRPSFRIPPYHSRSR